MPEGTNSISLTAGPRHVLRRYRYADKCIGRYQRGWSGALSAATPQQLDRPSTTLQRAKRVEEICGGLTREVHVHRPQHCKPMVCLSPDHASGEFRSLACFGVRVSIGQRVRGNPNLGRQDKSAAVGRAHMVGWIELFCHHIPPPCWRFRRKRQYFQEAQRHHRRAAPGSRPVGDTGDPSKAAQPRVRRRSASGSAYRGTADSPGA